MIELLVRADIFLLAFGAAMLVAAMALLFMLAGALTGDQKRVRRRLARIGEGLSAAESLAGNAPTLRRDTTDSSIQGLDRLIKRFPAATVKLRERLAATGRKISLGEYVLASLLVGIVAYAAFNFGGLALLPAAIFSVAVGLGLPYMFVGHLANRRRNRFILLLPEAIDLIVRGLRSGLPITESIKVVGQEIPDPVGTEFRRIIESFGLGLTLDKALWAASDRIGVPEFRFFVISLSVQQETGGNLTETLENLGTILRKRKQMKLKIRALTGEARASAAILAALPFFTFGALMVTSPTYAVVLLNTRSGHMLLAAGFVLMSVGIGIMIRMTKFEI